MSTDLRSCAGCLHRLASARGCKLEYGQPLLVSGGLSPPPSKVYPGRVCFMLSVAVGAKVFTGFGPTTRIAKHFAEVEAYKALLKEEGMAGETSKSGLLAGGDLFAERGGVRGEMYESGCDEEFEGSVFSPGNITQLSQDLERLRNALETDAVSQTVDTPVSDSSQETDSVHAKVSRTEMQQEPCNTSQANNLGYPSPLSIPEYSNEDLDRELEMISRAPTIAQVLRQNEQAFTFKGSPQNLSASKKVCEFARMKGLRVVYETKRTGPRYSKKVLVKATAGGVECQAEHFKEKMAKNEASMKLLEALLQQMQPGPPTSSVPSSLRQTSNSPTVVNQTDSGLLRSNAPNSDVETSHSVTPTSSDGDCISSNPIGQLQELMVAQGLCALPVYAESSRVFAGRTEYVCTVTAMDLSAQGMGPSKKLSKRHAAENLLAVLESQGMDIAPPTTSARQKKQRPPTIPSPPHPVPSHPVPSPPHPHPSSPHPSSPHPSSPHPVRRQHRRAKPSSVPRDPGSRHHSLTATRPSSSQRGEARPRMTSCDDTRPHYDVPRPRHSSFDDARPHGYDNCPRGVASPPFFDSRPPPPWREDGWPHPPPLPHSVMYDWGPAPGVEPHPSVQPDGPTFPPSHPHTFTPSHPHTFTPSHPHTFTPSHPHTCRPPLLPRPRGHMIAYPRPHPPNLRPYPLPANRPMYPNQFTPLLPYGPPPPSTQTDVRFLQTQMDSFRPPFHYHYQTSPPKQQTPPISHKTPPTPLGDIHPHNKTPPTSEEATPTLDFSLFEPVDPSRNTEQEADPPPPPPPPPPLPPFMERSGDQLPTPASTPTDVQAPSHSSTALTHTTHNIASYTATKLVSVLTSAAPTVETPPSPPHSAVVKARTIPKIIEGLAMLYTSSSSSSESEDGEECSTEAVSRGLCEVLPDGGREHCTAQHCSSIEDGKPESSVEVGVCSSDNSRTASLLNKRRSQSSSLCSEAAASNVVLSSGDSSSVECYSDNSSRSENEDSHDYSTSHLQRNSNGITLESCACAMPRGDPLGFRTRLPRLQTTELWARREVCVGLPSEGSIVCSLAHSAERPLTSTT